MGLLNWIEKNPLQAAALGTAAFATGGAALGAAGAAGAGGAAAAGEGAAAAGGLGSMASAVPTASQFAAMPTALGGGGLSAMGATGATGGSGLLGSGMQAMQAAGTAKGLLSNNQQPIQHSQLPQQSNGINDVLNQRLQAYQQYMQNRRV